MKKILLIEDDKALSVGVVYYFNKEGYLVDHMVSLKEAFEKFSKEIYEVILLDISLPDGEGYDFANRIRKISQVPIIFLTARDSEESLLRAFELGADDYITKPFSLKELNARIKSVLKRAGTVLNSGTKRVSGDIEVDILSLKVSKKGKNIDLTSSEYKLLNYFMDNYNIALSRDKILEFLWQSDAGFSAYSTVSVYINRLREKIEKDPGYPQYIVTKRGVGYMWSVEVK